MISHYPPFLCCFFVLERPSPCALCLLLHYQVRRSGVLIVRYRLPRGCGGNRKAARGGGERKEKEDEGGGGGGARAERKEAADQCEWKGRSGGRGGGEGAGEPRAVCRFFLRGRDGEGERCTIPEPQVRVEGGKTMLASQLCGRDPKHHRSVVHRTIDECACRGELRLKSQRVCAETSAAITVLVFSPCTLRLI